MPLVMFLQKFDYHVPGRPITLAYKPGQVRMVTTPCAQKAVAAGKAVLVRKEQPNEAGSQGG